jgi:thymidylate synthase (FAD)
LYHAKVSFFVAGISRRLTHELIRHYVGADRDEEGSPSMESTRYTLHPGVFVVPPRVLDEGELDEFIEAMTSAYGLYRDYIDKAVRDFAAKHEVPPKGLDRKRIHEAAAGLLPGQAATSLYWTANPASLTKMFNERLDSSADLEFQRLIRAWKAVCVSRWPNLFQTA